MIREKRFSRNHLCCTLSDGRSSRQSRGRQSRDDEPLGIRTQGLRRDEAVPGPLKRAVEAARDIAFVNSVLAGGVRTFVTIKRQQQGAARQ